MNNTKVFLFASPNDSSSIAKITRNCSFFCYYINKNGMLAHHHIQNGYMNPFMCLSDYGIEDFNALDSSKIAKDAVLECQHRRYSGIFLDFEKPSALNLLKTIYQYALRTRLALFVPLAFAHAAPKAKFVVPSAISGGNFKQRLQELKAKYGAENLCLDIVRCCHDFTMPSYMPDGKSLSAKEFDCLIKKYSPETYFSKDLCSKYFTYRNENGECHFVIFDDISTAISKLEMASSLGFFAAFILYSDFRDDIKDIINT